VGTASIQRDRVARWCLRTLLILGGVLLATVTAWLLSSANASADTLPGPLAAAASVPITAPDSVPNSLGAADLFNGNTAAEAAPSTMVPAAVRTAAPAAWSTVTTVRRLVAPVIPGLRMTIGGLSGGGRAVDGLVALVDPAGPHPTTPANAGGRPGPGGGTGALPGPGAYHTAGTHVIDGVAVDPVTAQRFRGTRAAFPDGPVRPVAGPDPASTIPAAPCLFGVYSPVSGAASGGGFWSGGASCARAVTTPVPAVPARVHPFARLDLPAPMGTGTQPGVTPD
jgi:hypothetical protein